MTRHDPLGERLFEVPHRIALRDIPQRRRGGKPAVPDRSHRMAVAAVPFRERLAGLEIRQQQNVRTARHWGNDLLGFCGLFAHCVVEGQRAVQDTAGNLTAVGHFR